MQISDETNALLRDCVEIAVNFRNSGFQDASEHMLDAALKMVRNPYEHLRPHHFGGDLESALRSAFGPESRYAELSIRMILRALSLWDWHSKVTGYAPSDTVKLAVDVKNSGGPWAARKIKILAILEDEPIRRGGQHDRMIEDGLCTA